MSPKRNGLTNANAIPPVLPPNPSPTPPLGSPVPPVVSNLVLMGTVGETVATDVLTPPDPAPLRAIVPDAHEDSHDDEEDDGEDEGGEEEDEGGKDEDEVPVSPFKLADEMERVSAGPKSVIASKFKQVVSVDDCAEILSLVTLQFKYLKGEICACGVRLTKAYKELGACSTCSGPKNPVNKLLCLNCKLVQFKCKWKELGYCQPCDSDIKKREAVGAKADTKAGAKKK